MAAAIVRINLLPHREEKRQARQRQFLSFAVLLAILAMSVVGLVHALFSARIEDQAARNKLLKSEIVKLDEQIREIDKLRDQIQQVLARKAVVENLQANRSEAVHLLDQLVRQLPDGIFLKAIKQTGTRVQMVGYAQSNARVSTLMRNIESSPWVTGPELVEIKLVNVPGAARGAPAQQANEFTLNFSVKRVVPQPARPPATPVAPAAAPAPSPGGKA
ncbi:MAG: PilN domain-containing protein [Burkholderiales bacterium]|nr:PilN domain-containing protein [Burkholderiales bacterium]MCC7115302.1 PilN domain-containing protein [Burkholderiales bacterium]